MKRLLLAATAVVTLSVSLNAQAETTYLDAFNCGQYSIKIGMSSEQIKSNCSQQPSFVSKRQRPALKASADGTKKEDSFEKWMYQSAGQNATHVLIKNGEVIRIFTNATQTARQ